jgi:hypothetical protein
MQPIGGGSRDARGKGGFACPSGALFLIVLLLRIVDGVVEPQCELDFARMFGEVPRHVELREAFFQVPDSVVAPMRLAVACDENPEELWIGMRRAQFLRQPAPAFVQGHG